MKTFKDLQVNDTLYRIELTDSNKFTYSKLDIEKISHFQTTVLIKCYTSDIEIHVNGAISIQKYDNFIYASDKQALINYFINIISIINLK